MGGGNNPFSFVERREEEDPEVCALVPFLFPFLVFVVVDAEKDILCVPRIQMPLSLSLLPRGKRIELEIDSRAFILSLSLSRMQHTDGAANARDDGRRDARIHGFRAVSVPPRVRPRLLLSPLRLGRGSVLLLSS